MDKKIIIALVVIAALSVGGFIYLSRSPAENGNGNGEGNGNPPEPPEGSLTVAELLANPVYDAPVKITGEAQLIGELLCTCFELSSGGEAITVWYDTMVDESATPRPPVSIEGLENGDTLVVIGELRESETDVPPSDFWASSITKAE